MPEAPTHFLELKTELIFFFSYMAGAVHGLTSGILDPT
jgi:hypothetical protein